VTLRWVTFDDGTPPVLQMWNRIKGNWEIVPVVHIDSMSQEAAAEVYRQRDET
jgi:hypothetical protein